MAEKDIYGDINLHGGKVKEVGNNRITIDQAPGSYVAEDNPGSIQQGGFLLEYVDDDTIRLEKGGKIAMTDFDGGFEMIDVPANETMDIATTGAGGLINGSSRTSDEWYGVGVIADSTESNSPALVAWTHSSSTDNTPTSVDDLPGTDDYDLFANLEQPRSGFIRTDDNQDILKDFRTLDRVSWSQTATDYFGVIYDSQSPSTGYFDISDYVPPVTCDVALAFQLADDGSVGSFFSLGATENHSLFRVSRAQSSQYGDGTDLIPQCKNQEFYANFTDASRFELVKFQAIPYYRVVGE